MVAGYVNACGAPEARAAIAAPHSSLMALSKRDANDREKKNESENSSGGDKEEPQRRS